MSVRAALAYPGLSPLERVRLARHRPHGTAVTCSMGHELTSLRYRPTTRAITQGLVDAVGKWTRYMGAWYPWLPTPLFRDDNPGGVWNYTYDWEVGRHVIHIPSTWDASYEWVIIHEGTHLMAQHLYMTRCSSSWPDLYSEWLAAMGGDPALRGDSQIHEMFAEHLTRARWPSYTGGSYPRLVGKVPFDALTELAYIDSIALQEDQVKWISDDLAIQTDAQGNASVVVPPKNMRQGLTAYGSAQRIGATSPQDLPIECSYQIDTSGPVAVGRLLVRGDFVKGGTAYYRLKAEQT